MKDYFSVTYTHFLRASFPEVKDVNSLLKPKNYATLNNIESEDIFYAFDNTQGISASFSFFDNNINHYIENSDEKLLDSINKKYNIRNNLSSYYENIVIHGKIFRDIYYVYNVIYIENKTCPGLYETQKVLLNLELPGPQILLTKINLYDIISLDNKGIILTQQNEIDYSSKLFIQN